MMRKPSALAVALLVIVAGTVAAAGPASAATTTLTLPASAAFQVLGYDCGGIREQAYATGFDPSNGFATGDVYLSTTCSSGGRGSVPSTHTAWASATWDFTGALVSDARLATAPTVDPSFSAYDSIGNQLYNQNASAYLVLAPGFVPAPRLLGISVSAGPASGGTSVTISGTGFTGATGVSFGDQAGVTVVVTSDTSISVVSPLHAPGTVDIEVTTAGGSSARSSSDQFTFVGQPAITSISPASGPVTGGTTVTVIGQNLAAASTLNLGDQQLGFTVVSDTELTFVTPPAESGPDSESISIASLGGTSNGAQFTYTALVKPSISLSPSSGLPGIKLTVAGKQFSPGQTAKVTYRTGLASPHPATITLCSAVSTASGTFTCSGTIAVANAGAVGAHTVKATQAASAKSATATFTLT